MNKKEEYPNEKHSDPIQDEWADSNEQEQRKIGFESLGNELTEKESTEIGGLPIDRQKAEPIRTDAKWISSYTQYSEKREDSMPNSSCKNNKKKHVFGWSMVMAGSLLTAVGFMVFSLITAANGASFVQDGISGSEGVVSNSSEKIVFVRQYDADSGILTGAELYAAKADTVVSVVAKEQHTVSVGSGFFLTSDGYIGTANHVVADAVSLTVLLSNGTAYPATKVAGNAFTDLAVLKIEEENLPAVTFGSSADLLTGEAVYAIGTPGSLDYAGSLCSGVVSCTKRVVRIKDVATGALEKKMTLIQTDAPVNPGNSGCPLFDETGHVIGVITMRLGNEFAGIGFAVPSDGAERIFQAMIHGEPLSDQILSAVSVSAPKLGISGEAKQLDGTAGVEIVRFSSEDASAAATLKIGDLITEIDHMPITSLSDISMAIDPKDPGETVMVTVLRAGQLLSFSIVLGK